MVEGRVTAGQSRGVMTENSVIISSVVIVCKSNQSSIS